MFGLSGTALTSGAVGGNSSLTTMEIEQRVAALNLLLDVDDNSNVDPLTDGLIVLRYLQGTRGTPMIAGLLGSGAMRTDAGNIATYLDQYQTLATPGVTAIAPADGASFVPVGTSIVVTFNKAMLPGSITYTKNSVCKGSIQLSVDDFVTCVPFGGPPLATLNDTQFALQPAVPLTPGFAYKVRVTTEAVDALGVPMLNLVTQPAGFMTE
jgi:hypothetical protein